MENEDLRIRIMTSGDIEAGMRLRESAGWNQTTRDWQRFLTLEPRGCFVALLDGKVVGTVTTLTFEKLLGWISMVLVDPDHRGRGIGTKLLRKAVQHLQSEGIETIKLDATPMGHPLYLQLGFVDEYRIERWEGVAGSGSGLLTATPEEAEFEKLLARDLEVFGVDRSRLLRCLWHEGPGYCAMTGDGQDLAGYILGRAGTRAHYLGPWVARDRAAAETLFRNVMSRVQGEPVFVDICCENESARSIVESAGFSKQRTLTRMFLGPNRNPGKPALVCGIAGPELG